MLDDWDWKEQAACKNFQQIFFPKTVSAVTVSRARAICGTCPVQKQCKHFADGNHEEYGIWSGNDYSSAERKRVKAAKAKCQKKLSDTSNITTKKCIP